MVAHRSVEPQAARRFSSSTANHLEALPDRLEVALAALARPSVVLALAVVVAVLSSTEPEALEATGQLVEVEAEVEALELPVELVEAAATDTWQLQPTDMQVVQVNREARTYIGPWEWSDESVPSGDYLTLQDAVAKGYTPEPPVPPAVPESVPAWALSAVLDARGKLTELQAAIDKLTPASTRTRVQWLFRRGDQFERDGDVVNGLGAAIGYTPEQVDQLFRDAEAYANA